MRHLPLTIPIMVLQPVVRSLYSIFIVAPDMAPSLTCNLFIIASRMFWFIVRFYVSPLIKSIVVGSNMHAMRQTHSQKHGQSRLHDKRFLSRYLVFIINFAAALFHFQVVPCRIPNNVFTIEPNLGIIIYLSVRTNSILACTLKEQTVCMAKWKCNVLNMHSFHSFA